MSCCFNPFKGSTPRVALLLCLLGGAGCTTIKPQASALNAPVESEQRIFDYRDYETVLQQFVNESGRVNYSALKQQPDALERFYAQIASLSPDSTPSLFPSPEDRLAYWINAYNATVMKAVMTHYPIASVEAVKASPFLFFLPDLSGFFLLQRMTYGGAQTSLHYIENNVIRKRFQDPQIHFALNCASLSCPQLPQSPFYPQSLAADLLRETEIFINDPQNVSIDAANKTIYLSAIFQWYESDFTDWLSANHPDKPATLVQYIKLYLNAEGLIELSKIGDDPIIKYLAYDWGLNRQ